MSGLQVPAQPDVIHTVVLVEGQLKSAVEGATQRLGAFVADAALASVFIVVVDFLSLHPNHPGVWHVVVVVEEVLVAEVVI